MAYERLIPSSDFDSLPTEFESDEQARQFAHDTLLMSLKPEAAGLWWNRPNYEFGGITPADMWTQDPQAVIELVESYREGGGT